MKLFACFITILMFSITTFAQSLEVVYGEKRDLSGQIESNSNPQVKAILANLAKEESIYTLQYNSGKSIYSKTADATKTTNAQVINLTGSEYAYYKDQGVKKAIEQNTIFKKEFLINEELTSNDWKFAVSEDDEPTEIGGYKVSKAIGLFNGGSCTVFYTEEIAVNEGPRSLWGLPGLILRAQGSGKIIEAKSVKWLKEELSIAKPDQGKLISRDDYNLMKSEKEADLLNGYGGGNVITIQKN